MPALNTLGNGRFSRLTLSGRGCKVLPRSRSFAVVVLGRSAILREGIAQVLRTAGFRNVVSQPMLDDIPPKLLPQYERILFIVVARDELDPAIRQITILKDQHPAARIAVLIDDLATDNIMSILRAGAHACFTEPGTCDVFFKSLELIMLGETILPSAVVSSLLNSQAPDQKQVSPVVRTQDSEPAMKPEEVIPHLSQRERNILNCLIEGQANKS